MIVRVKGRKFTYLQQKCRLPNGVVTDLEMIDYPAAALIIPFVARDKIIFLKQYRPVLKKYLYELPAGTCDQHESPYACARREVIEETGFAARLWKKLGKIYLAPGYSTEVIHIYAAGKLSPAQAEADRDEIIKIKIFTRQQVYDLVRKGVIVDAKTLCALMLCKWLSCY